VSPDLDSSNHQPLPPGGGKMTKNEIVTESGVQFKQAKQAHYSKSIANAQTSNPARRNQKCTTISQRALNQLRHPLNALSNHLAPK
jgi:hypothetical protein